MKEETALINDDVTRRKNYEKPNPIDLSDFLHGLLPGPFLPSYSVFGFSFSLFFRLCAVR